jgi:hypothetical protein
MKARPAGAAAAGRTGGQPGSPRGPRPPTPPLAPAKHKKKGSILLAWLIYLVVEHCGKTSHRGLAARRRVEALVDRRQPRRC